MKTADGKTYISKINTCKPKKTTKRKPRIESQDEFEIKLRHFLDEKRPEQSKNGAKLNLGDGLAIYVKKDGVSYFQFVYCIHGKNSTIQIGRYPEEKKFEAARKIADGYRDEIKEKRNDAKNLTLKRNLNGSSRHKSLPCFKSMHDAKRFSKTLTDTLCFGSSFNQDQLEAYLAIYLLLLLPDHDLDLLNLAPQDVLTFCRLIDPTWLEDHRYNSTVYFYDNTNNAHQQSALKINIMWIFNRLDALYYPNRNTLFPRLHGKGKAEIYRFFNASLKLIWDDYPVDVRKFKAFFQYQAIQQSEFAPSMIDKFLDQALMHKNLSKYHFDNIEWKKYRFRIWALRMWWIDLIKETPDIP
ncbi:Arm DNA-binding domain-containing protein [Undibacterium rugosum]|uniref:DUF4102 domain-containing protein n=1 Tax=Undibacterium rugosum TaxID=2762291 RepID=A0A923I0M3_9BURK|nr:Arm DNA-binding domain-containing protein [Undibacterium rugosum]MBC3935618.1 DUF4102 domain-containing protein [Undibacterium rugosum]MBR7779016.1 DUF4102 domain-containing protein [Undibacterium rugosum]